jgi:predicted ester cyclase
MQGLPPTGKEVAIIGVTIIRLADDKIAEVWDYVDLLGLLQQLGAIPTGG